MEVHGLMEDDDNSNSRNCAGTLCQYWYNIRNFPDSLLIEILVRLPLKSIFMFKSMCKHWQTLISHPSFCRFYHSILNSNAALSRPFKILEKFTYVPNFREFINRLRLEIHSSKEFSVLFLCSREGPVRRGDDQYRYIVLNMSNGLILCRWNSSTQLVYYICDPLTGQWSTLRKRVDGYQGNFAEGLLTRVNEDHMLIDYTVVKLNLGKSRSNILNLEMFSSKTGEWIGYELPCTILIRRHDVGTLTIHCHGALHWRVRSYDNGIHVMLAFDPYKDPKSVRLIALPHDRDLWSEKRSLGSFQLCGECQGTLRYFQVADVEYMADADYLFSMWAMKDYEKGEWCCEFKVRRSDVHSNDPKLSKWLLDGRGFMPLSFHPLISNVVYLTCMKPLCVVSYNVLNRRLDVMRKPIHKDESIGWRSAVPFMLPKWPVLV